MRLMEIKDSVNIAYSNYAPRWDNSNGNFYLRDILRTKVAIIELNKIHFLKDSDNEILPLIKSSETDFIILTSTQYSSAVTYLGHLKIAIAGFHYWINQYIPNDDTETTVSIKMPPMGTLEDLKNYSDLLQKALGQVIPEIGGELKFRQLEYGSCWVIIDLSTVEAVAFFVSLVISAMKIAKMYSEFKLNIAKSKHIKLSDSDKSTFENVYKEIIKKNAYEEAMEVEKKYYSNGKSDTERIMRISVSINNVSDFISKGGELHLSSLASEKNKKLLSAYEQSNISQKKVEKLPHKENSSEETEVNDKKDTDNKTI
jgi:hypothetical protein